MRCKFVTVNYPLSFYPQFAERMYPIPTPGCVFNVGAVNRPTKFKGCRGCGSPFGLFSLGKVGGSAFFVEVIAFTVDDDYQGHFFYIQLTQGFRA